MRQLNNLHISQTSCICGCVLTFIYVWLQIHHDLYIILLLSFFIIGSRITTKKFNNHYSSFCAGQWWSESKVFAGCLQNPDHWILSSYCKYNSIMIYIKLWTKEVINFQDQKLDKVKWRTYFLLPWLYMVDVDLLFNLPPIISLLK